MTAAVIDSAQPRQPAGPGPTAPIPAARLPQAGGSAPDGQLRGAETNPLVKDLLKRFAADVVRREPLDHAAWQAKLRREADHGRQP